MTLRIAGTVNDSIVDGEGLRYTIFVQGCPHHCNGCHNPQTHSFSGGKEVTVDELYERILRNPLLDGVTFSGGEPFCQAEALSQLGRKIKDFGLTVWCYSGWTFEELLERGKQDKAVMDLLQTIDILVDGRFEIDQKTLSLPFRGSRNQKIIDVPASLQRGECVVSSIGESYGR